MIKKRKNKISLRPDRETFEKRYYDQCIEIERLAKLWGVKKQTIYNWAYQYKCESQKKDLQKNKRNYRINRYISDSL